MTTEGRPAIGTLRIAADVVAEETITVGDDVYRVAVVDTDSTQNTSGGQLNNTNPIVGPVTIPAHGLIGGDVIRVESEFMLVTNRLNANQVTLKRGISNSTIAAHADGIDIFTEAVKGAGGIAVCMTTTLTPTVFTPRFVADVNARGRNYPPYGAIQIDVNTVVFYNAVSQGGDAAVDATAVAVAEDMSGSGNAWDDATFVGGDVATNRLVVTRVPIAAEVTKGLLHIVFPFTPTIDKINVQTTATGAVVAWDGNAAVDGKLLTLDNTGNTDWATTDTITVFARG